MAPRLIRIRHFGVGAGAGDLRGELKQGGREPQVVSILNEFNIYSKYSYLKSFSSGTEKVL